MKKISLFAIIALLFVACSSDNGDVVETPKMCSFNVDYTFAESGDMKAVRSGADLYTAFYNDYIKTKQITPAGYQLTFKNSKSNIAATFVGSWGSPNMINLTAGEYTVTGYSNPSNDYLQPYLIFNQKITISAETTNIQLTAGYNCILLMFDKADKSEIKYYYNKTDHDSITSTDKFITLAETDNIYYMFTTSGYGVIKCDNDIIYLRELTFETGKYYYFNDVTGTFDIPQMEAGN